MTESCLVLAYFGFSTVCRGPHKKDLGAACGPRAACLTALLYRTLPNPSGSGEGDVSQADEFARLNQRLRNVASSRSFKLENQREAKIIPVSGHCETPTS